MIDPGALCTCNIPATFQTFVRWDVGGGSTRTQNTDSDMERAWTRFSPCNPLRCDFPSRHPVPCPPPGISGPALLSCARTLSRRHTWRFTCFIRCSAHDTMASTERSPWYFSWSLSRGSSCHNLVSIRPRRISLVSLHLAEDHDGGEGIDVVLGAQRLGFVRGAVHLSQHQSRVVRVGLPKLLR